MRTMPRLLLLLFGMSVVTMMFIARCGLNMDSQLHNSPHGGMPVSSGGSPGEKALREVMRRKEVEHLRDKSVLQEKIKSLESQLSKVQGQVNNLTASMHSADHDWAQHPARGANDSPYSNNGAYQGVNINQNIPPPNAVYRHAPDKPQSYGESHLRFPSDGLNPLPMHRPQHNERVPLYDHINRARSSIEVRDRAGPPFYDQRLVNPLADVEGIQRNIRNSAEQLGGVHFRNIGVGNHELDMGVVDRHALGVVESEDNANKADFMPRFGPTSFGMDSARVPRSAPVESSEFRADPRDGTSVDSDILRRVNASFEYVKYFHERLKSAEILSGQPYKTEYELIPFNRFIYNRIYMVDPGLGKRVVEKPIGSKKKDLNEILYHAVESLNNNRTEAFQYSYDDFVEGVYRTDPAWGSHYELYFINKDDSKRHNSYVKLSVFRPFAPPMTVSQNVITTGPEWINIILPLSKRVETFRQFMEQFVRVCIKHDKRIYLTVVYFGPEGLKEVKSIMGHVAKANKFKHMKLVTLNETFARGRGLQIGALNWKGGGDVLMFFCDVDIVFSPEFLERCRLNSERGQRVYYPIVFSLYNPKIVYSLQDVAMPPFQDQLVLSKDTGFWRDFGYGMTCQYRSDFLKIKGFDEQITGWGGEDVFLYQKFVRSDYFVVRATDPAIFHLWHEKFCDPTLTAEQYKSCIRSKALNEASHAQLGLLAFKDEIDVHRGVSERNSLLSRGG
ncbi:unnamed protein product, partial [Lymnaea stagnalis]